MEVEAERDCTKCHPSTTHPPNHTTPHPVLTTNAGLHVCVSRGWCNQYPLQSVDAKRVSPHVMDTLADHPHLSGNTRLVNIPVKVWRCQCMCPREGGCFTHTQIWWVVGQPAIHPATRNAPQNATTHAIATPSLPPIRSINQYQSDETGEHECVSVKAAFERGKNLLSRMSHHGTHTLVLTGQVTKTPSCHSFASHETLAHTQEERRERKNGGQSREGSRTNSQCPPPGQIARPPILILPWWQTATCNMQHATCPPLNTQQ